MRAVRIGTRGSALARWQAERVKSLLAARGCASSLVPITTSGDRRGAKVGPVKGLFTKEIEDALLDGRIDAAVHSLKDLWVELPRGLVLAAVPEREDPRDALVGPRRLKLAELPAGARVGTSSLRRTAALRAARPDLAVVALEGNVPTRVGRVDQGLVDAAVLALAGLKRLALAERATPLDPALFVPAAGQGALAVEARADDQDILDLLRPLERPEARTAVEAERAALAELGAGCNVPIGAYCSAESGALILRVAIYAPDERPPAVAVVEVDPARPRAAGVAAANQLRRTGAAALLQ